MIIALSSISSGRVAVRGIVWRDQISRGDVIPHSMADLWW